MGPGQVHFRNLVSRQKWRRERARDRSCLRWPCSTPAPHGWPRQALNQAASSLRGWSLLLRRETAGLFMMPQVLPWLAMPASHMGAPVPVPAALSSVQLLADAPARHWLLTQILESPATHMGDPDGRYKLLTLGWPMPGCFSHLGCQSVGGRALSPSPCHHSALQINKH